MGNMHTRASTRKRSVEARHFRFSDGGYNDTKVVVAHWRLWEDHSRYPITTTISIISIASYQRTQYNSSGYQQPMRRLRGGGKSDLRETEAVLYINRLQAPGRQEEGFNFIVLAALFSCMSFGRWDG
ncbi:hypothetical protein VE01_10748 [Pseudogymnoascus verrucosus]|uniref:Uncharacterized protein n=1 Tax=Pseudogymnoascus verrucosus TaxID=342668 RepID=A0A2P6FGT0_9PEZI|nr:uncharacterized protein VE01_10748 [Pseudogymnoascus verrucosus]PQM43852.1 hypothetical protein VE01_10748 [Pseudogymnoascus verrucosus]